MRKPLLLHEDKARYSLIMDWNITVKIDDLFTALLTTIRIELIYYL